MERVATGPRGLRPSHAAGVPPPGRRISLLEHPASPPSASGRSPGRSRRRRGEVRRAGVVATSPAAASANSASLQTAPLMCVTPSGSVSPYRSSRACCASSPSSTRGSTPGSASSAAGRTTSTSLASSTGAGAGACVATAAPGASSEHSASHRHSGRARRTKSGAFEHRPLVRRSVGSAQRLRSGGRFGDGARADDTIATAALRGIEGLVGCVDQLDEGLPFTVELGDPEIQRHENFAVALEA